LRRDQGQEVMFRKELKHDPHFLRVNHIIFFQQTDSNNIGLSVRHFVL
jgi:hypothetical protein